MKRCFVISPIGSEGSQIREHADDVFDFIVKPAMELCKIEPVRSDHLQEPGKITEQMFREILYDDLSIAILTGHNPNVFYELAIAHAAGKPVIVLIEKEEAVPFDIRDLRCVHYDLKPRSLFDKVYVNQIISHIKTLEANNWKVPNIFGKSILQNDAHDDVNMFSFYRNGNDFGSHDKWLRLLDESTTLFEIMGIHLGPWRGNKFSELISKKTNSGCKVRVLIMHPENPSISEMINESLTDVDLDTTIREINEMSKYFSKIAEKFPNFSFKQIKNGTLHCQTTRTDDYAVYLPYMYTRRRRDCPIWHSKKESILYKTVAEEFEGLWQVNSPNLNK